MTAVTLEAFGVRFGVEVEGPAGAAAPCALLPPGSRPVGAGTGPRFALTAGGDVFQDSEVVARAGEAGHDALAAAIRAHVALNAPAHIFVHAGVVAVDGRALLLPGPSFSGKTTLVAALVRAGATYFSDEFAVLDADGRVHPYPKPLSIRMHGGWAQTDVPAATLGGATSTEPAAVGTVAITAYREGAVWGPRRLARGAGALALLANAIPARSRPAETLAAVSRAAGSAVVIESPRGDAEALAADIMRTLTDGVGWRDEDS